MNLDVLTYEELYELYDLLYHKNTRISYDLLKHIKYFDFGDLNPYFESEKYKESLHFTTIWNNKDIIGLCKFAYYNLNNHYSISYLSVHKNYQHQNFSAKLLDKTFSFFALNYPYEKLYLSGYSIEGWKYLRKNILYYANKYHVEIVEQPIQYVTKWDDESRNLYDESRKLVKEFLNI
jgi:predicted GNAT family N-acyltransferase